MNIKIDEKCDDNSDAYFASLFRDVSPRPPPPAETEAAVYTFLIEQWRCQQAKRRQRKRLVFWSVAASVLMALLIQPLVFHSKGVVEALGTVEKHKGTVSISHDNQRDYLASQDQTYHLLPGQKLVTAADSGVSIKWNERMTIRVDQNTELNLRSTREIELISGQIYVDIPASAAPSQTGGELQIVTRYGSIRHIGTQFMVSSDNADVVVKVRDGSVSIENSKLAIVAHAGEQKTLGPAGNVASEAIAAYGPDWQWVEQLAPAFVLEARPLTDFLGWIHRETGKKIVFENTEAEHIAENTIMYGSTDDEPMRALDIILQTNDLSWYERDGAIHIFLDH